MAYDIKEASPRDGAPIEFLKFAISGGAQWLYNSTDVAITYLGEVYEPLFLQRDDRSLSGNNEDQAVRLQAPLNLPVIEAFKVQPPHQRIYVSYYRQHQSDSEVKGFYQGYVGGVKFGHETAEIVINNLSGLMEKASPRATWQHTCRFHLYDGELNGGHGCPVPRAPYKLTALVATHTGSTLTSATLATKPDGWFQFGFVQRPDGYRSMILSHVGDTVTLLAPFLTSVQGLTLDFYAGCNQSWDTCKSSKFSAHTDSGRAFGGAPRIPEHNPNSTGIR